MKRVIIIGMGVMGALIEESLKTQYQTVGVARGDSLEEVKDADMVIVAVKPQSFLALGQDLKRFIDKQIVLSIMAGVTCEQISKQLGTTHVVRLMPNLGLAKAKSVTGAYSVDQKDVPAANKLVKLWGSVLWLKSEDYFDGFTALAGSGPAYFFEVTHQLELAAKRLGFDEKTARYIANNTLVSAAAVIGNKSAAERTKQVASKGGVTEAALAVLAKRNFGRAISEAVMVSTAKSKELTSRSIRIMLMDKLERKQP